MPKKISIEKIPIYIDLKEPGYSSIHFNNQSKLFERYIHNPNDIDRRYDSMYIVTGGDLKETFSPSGLIVGTLWYSLYWFLIYALSCDGECEAEVLTPLSVGTGFLHTLIKESGSGGILKSKVTSINLSGNGKSVNRTAENYSNNLDKILMQQIPYEIKQLHSLADKYNSIDYTAKVRYDYKKEIKPYGAKKGEFETSKQYKKRRKEEKIKIQHIDERYDLKYSQAQQMEEVDKQKLIEKIKKSCSYIKLYKQLPFEVSNYNADLETYTFTMEKKGNRKFSRFFGIPLSQAPKFKETLNDLTVNKIYRPILRNPNSSNITIGWIEMPDTMVVINTKNSRMIPWAYPAFNLNEY